jgi:GNAT superfamily N-acetyltransferase
MNTPYPELMKEMIEERGITYEEALAKYNECHLDIKYFEVHMLTERNEKGELIGYMVYDYPKDTYEKGDKKGGQIEYMYVCEGHRNKGIGTRMITEAITQMEKVGRTRLKCDAHWDDMRFLSKFGFKWDAPPTGGLRAMYRMTMPYAEMFRIPDRETGEVFC